jgi:3-methylfumaryl-CoA hydratase
MSDSHQKLDDWLGTERVAKDHITAFPLAALAATLDREQSGDTVPPLWHWLYFLPIAPMSETGPDGHPKRGDFLPPVPLPRRMWAGGRITFHAPLKVGERATRTPPLRTLKTRQAARGASCSSRCSTRLKPAAN